MPTPHSPKQNHLLAALPAADHARLLSDLELIPMPLGWAVYESGSHLGYVFSDHQPRLAALRDGKWRFGGNHDHRQLWFGRHFLVHGRLFQTPVAA